MQIQSQWDTTSHPPGWLQPERDNEKCWRGCGEAGALTHCWWECKMVRPITEQSGSSWKPQLPHNLASSLSGRCTKEIKLTRQCSQQHYLQWPKSGNSPHVYPLTSGQKEAGVSHAGRRSGTKRQASTDAGRNADGPWKHFTEWKTKDAHCATPFTRNVQKRQIRRDGARMESDCRYIYIFILSF